MRSLGVVKTGCDVRGGADGGTKEHGTVTRYLSITQRILCFTKLTIKSPGKCSFYNHSPPAGHYKECRFKMLSYRRHCSDLEALSIFYIHFMVFLCLKIETSLHTQRSGRPA